MAASQEVSAADAQAKLALADRSAREAVAMAGASNVAAMTAKSDLFHRAAAERIARDQSSVVHASVERASRSLAASQANCIRATSREAAAREQAFAATSHASAERIRHTNDAARLTEVQTQAAIATATEINATAMSQAANLGAEVARSSPVAYSPLYTGFPSASPAAVAASPAAIPTASYSASPEFSNSKYASIGTSCRSRYY
ncbi:hypothetical protein DIPPA_34417 [Diplonema papillatum]|nr:hypothetical protein DIPPA_34417 [Diplonema papillatum]